MRYVANPVVVEAFRIVDRFKADCMSGLPLGTVATLKLENGETVEPTKEMMARMEPQIGDYWVISADGYIYLNPKDVFERKYRPESAAAA